MIRYLLRGDGSSLAAAGLFTCEFTHVRLKLSVSPHLQPNCCQPTSMETVEVVYVDQHSTVTMASMQLPSRCSCGRGDAEPASVE